MPPVSAEDYRLPAYNSLLFRVALARSRPCYCYGCICLNRDERAYQRRVFKLARAWGKKLRRR